MYIAKFMVSIIANQTKYSRTKAKVALLKEIKDNNDSFNLVEPLEPRFHVSPKLGKYICSSEVKE
jgi:hypothetical protein